MFRDKETTDRFNGFWERKNVEFPELNLQNR